MTIEALAGFFASYGFVAHIARVGTQEFALFRGPSDAASLNIDMPGVSGYESARPMRRARAARAHGVLIAVTGRTACLENSAGCRRCIKKKRDMNCVSSQLRARRFLL